MDLTNFAVVMATVVFVVLVIFMMEPPSHQGTVVDLPFAHHSLPMRRAMRWDAMVVTILRDGKVYLKQDYTEPGQLPQRIRECLADGAERKVYLKVDRMAKYGDVSLVLAEVRSAGIENIGILVIQSQPPEAPSRH
jgi:biopolymer transport protein ExbD